MVSVLEFVILAVFSAFLYVFLKNQNNGKGGKGLKPLPGPRGLPILGSILSMGAKSHLALGDWVKYYGHVFQVNVLGTRLLVISDLKTAREANNNPVLLGKPKDDMFKLFSGGDYGVLATEGSEWVEQRRFMIRHLRDFGFGKSVGHELVMDEVDDFLRWLKSQSEKGKPVTLGKRFHLAVVNSLWRMMTGKRFDQNDPQLHKIIQAGNDSVETLTNSPIGIYLPTLAKTFPNITGWNKVVEAIDSLNVILRGFVKEHKENFAGESGDVPSDFVDSYIQQINTTTDPKSTFHKDVGNQHLIAALADLFGAGSNTQSFTLSWNVLYMSSFPQVQKKLQQQIDTVVGKSRPVTLADRKDLPYVEAVVLETLRKSSIAPMGLVHSAMEDTTLNGYFIPKGTRVALNLYFIHHDPEVWGDADNFRPERFLSQDGKTVEKKDNIVAFSVGKRKCIGEQLAHDTLFLFIASMYQRFSFSLNPADPKPILESKTNFFLEPHPFSVIVKDRLLTA